MLVQYDNVNSGGRIFGTGLGGGFKSTQLNKPGLMSTIFISTFYLINFNETSECGNIKSESPTGMVHSVMKLIKF